MVAIDLTKLEQQIAQLASLYAEPARFSQALQELLSFYQRYSFRPSRHEVPKTFLRAYNLPSQVLPQIEIGLRRTAQQHPSETLTLAQALWQEPYFEARDIAAYLLGQLPASEADHVATLLSDWLAQPQDRGALDALLSKAVSPLKQTGRWKPLVFQFLASPETRQRNVGLAALAQTLADFPLEDLPGILNEIKPLLEASDEKLAPNLAKVIEGLAKRSPQETAYLLKLVLVETSGSIIERRMRGYLPYFPPESAQSLQEAIKKHARQRELAAQVASRTPPEAPSDRQNGASTA